MSLFTRRPAETLPHPAAGANGARPTAPSAGIYHSKLRALNDAPT